MVCPPNKLDGGDKASNIVLRTRQETNAKTARADMENLKISYVNLLGDCLLTSSFLSYLGAFSYEFRMNLMNKM